MPEAPFKKHKRGHNEGSIRKRPDGVYEARVTCGTDLKTGKPIRKSFYSKSRKVVKERMEKALDELKINGTISHSKTFTVGEWLNHWLVAYKLPVSKSSTMQNLKNIIDNYLAPIHKLKLDKLRPVEVQQIYNSIDTAKSTKMVESTHSCLNNAFKYAIKLGYANYNPCQATFLPKKKGQAVKALDKEQQAAFVNALENSTYKNMLLFYLLTGLRRGELVGLEWKDIDLEQGYICVRGSAVRNKDFFTGKTETVKSSTKTTAGNRKIPISSQLKAIINKLIESKSGDYLFCNENGGMLSLDVPDREFDKVRTAADLKGFSLHSLRHTFATRVYESVVRDKVAQALLGHASDSTTKQIYIHANDDYIKEESKKINILD